MRRLIILGALIVTILATPAIALFDPQKNDLQILEAAMEYIRPHEASKYQENAYFEVNSGKWHIAWGFNLEDPTSCSQLMRIGAESAAEKVQKGDYEHIILERAKGDELFRVMVQDCLSQARDIWRAVYFNRPQYADFDKLPIEARLVAIDMLYQLGPVTFRNEAWYAFFPPFDNTIVPQDYCGAINRLNHDDLANWRNQSGPNRVNDHISKLRRLCNEQTGLIDLPVPPVKQDSPAGCARACALMTIKYYCPDLIINSESAKSEIPDYAHVTERVVPGISRLSKDQVTGTWFRKSDVDWLDFVKVNIQKKYPLIVIIPDAQNLPWWKWSYSGGHYIVIRGIGSDESIICNDPVDGSRHIASKAEFQKAWSIKSNDASPWQGIVVIGMPLEITSPDLSRPTIAGMFATALVIDKSGSMTGEKIKKAKKAAYGYADASGDKDAVSLVGFSSSAESIVEPSQMSQAKGQLKQDILAVSAGGSTNIGSGLTIAHKHLSSCDAKGKMALIMTDGQHNTGTYKPEVEEFVRSGWPIYTVAFGKDADQDTLRWIAERTNGCFFPADSFNLTSVYHRINVQAHNGSIFRGYSEYIRPGKILAYTIPVDTDSKKIGFFTNWQGSRMETTLTTSSGQVVDKRNYSQLGKYSEESTYTFYEIDNPQTGNWQVQIAGFDIPASGEQINFHSFSYSDISSNILAFQPAYSNNQQLQIAVRVAEIMGDRQTPLRGIRIVADIKKPSSQLKNMIRDQISGPSRIQQLQAEDLMSIYNEVSSLKRQVQLYDDGQHGDINPGDGIYANSYADTPSNGPYLVTIFLQGNTSKGKHIDRILQETFQVGPIEQNSFTISDFLNLITQGNIGGQVSPLTPEKGKKQQTEEIMNSLLNQLLKKK